MAIFYPVAHRSDEEIAAIKARYETFDEQSIPHILRDSLGMSAVSWKKPESWSTSHIIYMVTVSERERPVVLRANIGWGKPEVYMEVEKRITDEVATMSIPVNRILYVDASRKKFPFDFQLQDMLEGMDIEAHFHGTREDYDQISFDLGRYVAMWGELRYEGFGRFDNPKSTMYDYIVTRLDEDIAFLCDKKILLYPDKVRNLFETYKPVMNVKTGTLVQYDLADHNMMFDGKRTITGIYDWEAAIIGDPVLDLASAPTWKTQYPRQKKMIEGYKSIRDLPNFFQEKMDIYRLRTMIWKMVYAKRVGILNDDRKKKFDAALSPFGLS